MGVRARRTSTSSQPKLGPVKTVATHPASSQRAIPGCENAGIRQIYQVVMAVESCAGSKFLTATSVCLPPCSPAGTRTERFRRQQLQRRACAASRQPAMVGQAPILSLGFRADVEKSGTLVWAEIADLQQLQPFDVTVNAVSCGVLRPPMPESRTHR